MKKSFVVFGYFKTKKKVTANISTIALPFFSISLRGQKCFSLTYPCKLKISLKTMFKIVCCCIIYYIYCVGNLVPPTKARKV